MSRTVKMIAIPIAFAGEGEFDEVEYGKLVLREEDVRFFFPTSEDAEVVKIGVEDDIFSCVDKDKLLQQVNNSRFMSVPIDIGENREEMVPLYLDPGYITRIYIMQNEPENTYFQMHGVDITFDTPTPVEDLIQMIAQKTGGEDDGN